MVTIVVGMEQSKKRKVEKSAAAVVVQPRLATDIVPLEIWTRILSMTRSFNWILTCRAFSLAVFTKEGRFTKEFWRLFVRYRVASVDYTPTILKTVPPYYKTLRRLLGEIGYHGDEARAQRYGARVMRISRQLFYKEKNKGWLLAHSVESENCEVLGGMTSWVVRTSFRRRMLVSLTQDRKDHIHRILYSKNFSACCVSPPEWALDNEPRLLVVSQGYVYQVREKDPMDFHLLCDLGFSHVRVVSANVVRGHRKLVSVQRNGTVTVFNCKWSEGGTLDLLSSFKTTIGGIVSIVHVSPLEFVLLGSRTIWRMVFNGCRKNAPVWYVHKMGTFNKVVASSVTSCNSILSVAVKIGGGQRRHLIL